MKPSGTGLSEDECRSFFNEQSRNRPDEVGFFFKWPSPQISIPTGCSMVHNCAFLGGDADKECYQFEASDPDGIDSRFTGEITPGWESVSYTHLTLPTICSV